MHHTHHSGCSHSHLRSNTPVDKGRLLWTALILISSFAIAEWLISLVSHSLALLAEAGHMLSDALSLGVALLATWLAAFPTAKAATGGYRRVEILAALFNAIGLVAIALWIGWEAILRLQSPSTEILGVPMLVTAVVGVGVNGLNAVLLHDHSHHDLNLRGAFLHMVADAISSVGVLLAAIAIWQFHWNWADGGISLLVALLILWGAIPLLRDSLNVLLEKTPNHLDLDSIRARLLEFESVLAVEQLRSWAIAPGQESLAAHLQVNLPDGEERDRLLCQIQQMLAHDFGIQDGVVQLTTPPLINLSVPKTLEC